MPSTAAEVLALRHPALDVGNQLFGGCRPQRIRPGAEWSSNAFNRGRGLRGDPLTTLALSGRAQVRLDLESVLLMR